MCVKKEILATLSYFDLFNYPLKPIEIVQFLGVACTVNEIGPALSELEQEQLIYKLDEFYALQNNSTLVTRRRTGNLKARQLLMKADKIASLLSYFPFVRGVAVSGSLSKNFADVHSDIDFFIITKSSRLWLARTFMHCFKKITFLAGKQHFFCMNYYIDDDTLVIKEKNIFTAIEVATLMPLRGIDTFKSFFQNNKWANDFLPNHNMHISYVKENKYSLIKNIAEWIFDNKAGDRLDTILMKITAQKWSAKTKRKKLNRNGVIMSLDANKHYAKPSPENFQMKLLQRYEMKLFSVYRQFEQKAETKIVKL
ncbi:MAG TPA: hypothetical protein VK616_09225 [Flavitalea sp.]|nr:hypothetical protein [Flavitalea sp.]